MCKIILSYPYNTISYTVWRKKEKKEQSLVCVIFYAWGSGHFQCWAVSLHVAEG